MTNYDWLKQNFNHITLTTQIMKSNGSILTVPEYCVDLTIGLITCKDKEEWSKLVFTNCPLGTIIEEIPDDYYQEKLILVRNLLTKKLLTEQNKLYDKYLKILERRFKETWAPETSSKQVQVESKSQDIKISIVDF